MITDKLNQEWARNETADAVFEFRAAVQNFYNVLAETVSRMDEIAARAEFGPVDSELKVEGQTIRTIITNSKTDLDSHLDFVNWSQP